MKPRSALVVVVISLLQWARAAAAADLLFTPLPPCRVIDTRLSTTPPAGRLTPGTNYSFTLRNPLSSAGYSSQGGNPAGCGMPYFTTRAGSSSNEAKAVAVNIVAVSPTGPGNLRAWPTNQTMPQASVLNYAAVPGLNLANGVIVQTCDEVSALTPCTSGDVTFRADVSGAYLVVDITGYFHLPPQTTLGQTVAQNPLKIAMLQWYPAADFAIGFNAGGDINGPHALAFDGAHIWVANRLADSVTELNASDGSKVGTFSGGGDIYGPRALAFDGAHIWVANYTGNTVTQLNASDGSRVATFSAGATLDHPAALAFDGDHMWVANYGGNTVTRLAMDGFPASTVQYLSGPTALAFDGLYMWVANYLGNSVQRYDKYGALTSVGAAGGDINMPSALAFDGSHIWVANYGGNSVTELDASNGSKLGTFTAGGDISGPMALVFDGAHIWVANATGNSVTELDASNGSKVGTYRAGSDITGPMALAFDGSHVWVASTGNNRLQKF